MEQIAEQDGDWVLWCSNCGTLLVANEFKYFHPENWRDPAHLKDKA